jgi:hypothetical protein
MIFMHVIGREHVEVVCFVIWDMALRPENNPGFVHRTREYFHGRGFYKNAVAASRRTELFLKCRKRDDYIVVLVTASER